MSIIKVENISRTYGDVVKTYALKEASFEIHRGEFVAIIGPSGSGKSTLMHVLGLLDRATGGVYRFNGKDVSLLSDAELARIRNEEIGFVFQAFNLLPRTSVLKNVSLPLTYTKDRSEVSQRAKEIIEKVGLSHRLENLSNELSGGEKQRVAIARALINKPSVIFADEPTGNLDSESGSQVMGILQTLNNEGHTIILVTHEKETAELAERIITIVDGKIQSDRKVKDNKEAKKSRLLK